MQIIKFGNIIERLKNRSLTQSEMKAYVICFALLNPGWISSIPGFFNSQFSIWHLLWWIISIIILFCGVFYAFKKNGGNEGIDFINKFVILSWIVSCRTFVVIVPILVLISFILHKSKIYSTNPNLAFVYISTTVLGICIYQRVGYHIEKTKVKETNDMVG